MNGEACNVWAVGCRYAVQAMTSAYALYDFGVKHNETAATWNEDINKTYPASHAGQYMLYASAMIAWAHRCENENLPLCSEGKSRSWLAVAEQLWQYEVVRCFSFLLYLLLPMVQGPVSTTLPRSSFVIV